MTSSRRRASTVLLLTAVVAGGAWGAWLGWDHTYYRGEDGYLHGPYRWWQVVGCGLTVIAVAVVAARLWPRGRPGGQRLVAAAATVGVAVPWSVDAARTDESGLWLVGLLMLLIGGFAGLLVVLAATGAARRNGDAAKG